MYIKRVVAATLLVCGVLCAADTTNNPPNDPNKLLDEGQKGKWSAKVIALNVGANNHPSRGPENPKIDIIEFSDFQCPYCKQAERNIRALKEAYPGQVRLTYVNLPLSMHQFAIPAAKAALAAGEQGKFWQMHDFLMLLSPSLSTETIMLCAEQIGLDVNKFKLDFESDKLNKVLASDLNEVRRLNIPGTPTFFVNGHQLLDGGLTKDTVEELINEKVNNE